VTLRVPDRPLLVALEWLVAHLVVPDGQRRGETFVPTRAQTLFLASHYDVKADAAPGARGSAFRYRRSQFVRPQKYGKSPLAAAMALLEGVGPALFDGWAAAGDVYRCADNCCPCGWVYGYREGEPQGRVWDTPLIQITATSEEQTANVYAALRPMVELGPLANVIPRTGEEFIRLPGGGMIQTVTASARARLGARITFAVQDETGIWTPDTAMVKVAETQRRGLAGMDGRAVEMTNAWDPSQNSVAQRTAESTVDDVLRDHLLAPSNLSYRNKAERRKIHRHVYDDALVERGGWVVLEAIEAEASELLTVDPAQAERFFGNRIVAGSDAFLESAGPWDAAAAPDTEVPDGALVVVGFDGSMYDDHTVIRCRARIGDTWHGFTPRFPDGKAMVWNPTEHGGEVPRAEVQAAVESLFDRYDVVRMYADTELWQSELDAWAARFGDKRVVAWPTYRPAPMSRALERWATDLAAGSFTHDGCPVTRVHVLNARRVRRGAYVLVSKPHEHQKIDALVSDVLAHEAAGDVTAAGLASPRRKRYAAIG
jgi:hypothetical protein